MLLGTAAYVPSAQGAGRDFQPSKKETLILENPEGTIKNPGWFNIWAINAGGQYTGLHQLAMDTLWYIDPERGLDGPMTTRSLPNRPSTMPISLR